MSVIAVRAWTAIGIGLFAIWNFVVLELVWPRDAQAILLGASLCLNVATVGLIASAVRVRRTSVRYLTPARR